MGKKSYNFKSAKILVKKILDLAYFHPDNEGHIAIPALSVPGEGNLVVVVGDNAGGKSFFRRLVQGFCGHSEKKIECMHISAEGRRQISISPWLTFVYGDEQYESTGVNSTGTVLQGIKTCETREHPHVIFWDEPDLGLSEGYAAGMGKSICEFAKAASKHTLAAFVVTHSKALAIELAAANPHYLHLGTPAEEAPQTLAAWVTQPITIKDPGLLHEASRRRYKAIKKILDKNKP